MDQYLDTHQVDFLIECYVVDQTNFDTLQEDFRDDNTLIESLRHLDIRMILHFVLKYHHHQLHIGEDQ